MKRTSLDITQINYYVQKIFDLENQIAIKTIDILKKDLELAVEKELLKSYASALFSE